jgi:chaperone modulatory protein CbpM
LITLKLLLVQFPALPPDALHGWLTAGHIRAESSPDGPLFTDFDVERIRLILELREIFEVNDTALPLVLSLLDQMYELRRRLTSG